MNSSFDVRKVRNDFPCLHQSVYKKPLVYFDNAATAQKPQCVIDEVRNYYEMYAGNVHRGAHYLSEKATAKYNEARAYIGNFVGATHAFDVVFVRSTTEAINLIAHGLSKIALAEGDEIILSEMEHHANIVPWYLLAKEKNLQIKVAPINDDGTLDIEAFTKLFTPRVKVAAFAHASNALGTINPIHQMVSIAKSHNVITVIDGAQGAHHLPVDMGTLDADFYCFSAHKAYGPTGIGALVGKKEWLNRMPVYQGGGDMIETVSFDNITFAQSPLKFEAGTPNIAGVLGFKRALQYLDELGLDAIHSYETKLHDYAVSKLREIDKVTIIGNAPNKVSLVSFLIQGVHPHDVSSIFDREGIAIRAGHLCAQPLMKRFNTTAFSRASFAFYNTHDEIDHFINAFTRVFEVFRL